MLNISLRMKWQDLKKGRFSRSFHYRFTIDVWYLQTRRFISITFLQSQRNFAWQIEVLQAWEHPINRIVCFMFPPKEIQSDVSQTFLIRDSLWFFFLFGTKFSYDFLVRLFKFSKQHQNNSSSQPYVTFSKICKHSPFCIVLIGISYDIAATF